MMFVQLLAVVAWPALTQPMVIPAQQCGIVQPIHILLPQHHAAEPLAMLSDWHQHPLAKFANCFSVHWYALADLECQHAGERGRAQCRLPEWQGGVNEPQQIWFVPGEIGIAYNNGTRITLPLTASRHLMAHEIAHWYGFADEYAMPAELADKFCGGHYNFRSLNVVVTDTDIMTAAELKELWQGLPWHFAVPSWQQLATPIGQGQWRLGSKEGTEVGLFATQTCAHTPYYGWRPVEPFTPMHYHDIAVWPTLYLQLLQREF